MDGREDRAQLVEARAVLEDGLVLVAQKQEVRLREVACEHHELDLRVILHLVDHDEAHLLGLPSRHEELGVEPLGGREVAAVQQAHADAVDAQPSG